MKPFKIPKGLIYYALGLNTGIFFFGILLESGHLTTLAIVNSILCLFPFFVEEEED